MIRRIQREREMIILFVSHNMADIARLADRILVMEQGRLVMDGTPKEDFSKMEFLQSIGLNVPPVMQIMRKLSQRIREIDGDQLTPEAAEAELLRWLASGKTQ